MICDKCGAELKDDALFCNVCGANTVLAQLAAKKAVDPRTNAAKKPVPKAPSRPAAGIPGNTAPGTTGAATTPAPAADAPKAAVNSAKPVGNAPNPVGNAPKQAVNATNPAANSPKPATGAANPAAPKQAVNTGKPVVNTPKQAVNTQKQAVNSAKPANPTAPAGNPSSAPGNPVKSRPKNPPVNPPAGAAQKPAENTPRAEEPQEPTPTIIFTGHPSDLVIPRQELPEEPEKSTAAPLTHEEESMPEVGMDTAQQYYSSRSGATGRARLSPGIDDAMITGNKQESDPVTGLAPDLTTRTVKPIRVINWTPLKVVLKILAIILAVAVAAGVVMYFTGMLYKFGVVEKVYQMTGICIQHHYEPIDDDNQQCTICNKVTESGTPDGEYGEESLQGNTLSPEQ